MFLSSYSSIFFLFFSFHATIRERMHMLNKGRLDEKYESHSSLTGDNWVICVPCLERWTPTHVHSFDLSGHLFAEV